MAAPLDFLQECKAVAITPLMPVYPRCGVRPVRGEGVYLYGERGEQYLDFAAGIAVNAPKAAKPRRWKACRVSVRLAARH